MRAPRRPGAYLAGTMPLVLGWMLVAVLDTRGQALLKPAISYQGVLKDGAGNPVSPGNQDIYFRIFDETGILLWSESQKVAIDSSGLFNVELGSGTSTQDNPPPKITDDISKVFTQIGDSKLDQRYLELQVGDGSTPIAPRQRFLAAPYAFGVANIDHAEGPFLVDGILTASSDANVKGGLTVSQAATVTGTATVGVLQLPPPPGGDPFKISPGTSSPVTAYMDIGDGPGWVMHMRGTGNNVITFANDGRIGIKQPSPAVELDVNGTIRATNIIVTGTLRPFMIQSFQVNGTTDTGFIDTGFSPTQYSAAVAGFSLSTTQDESPKTSMVMVKMIQKQSATFGKVTWQVNWGIAVRDEKAVTGSVDVLFIASGWVTDSR